MNAAARFWAKVDKRGDDECWPWLAGRISSGYGAFSLGGKQCLAHRVAYSWAVGPIAAGLEIDHLCRNRACVNPAHLEAVTHAENVRRGLNVALKTHCKRGHPYTPENTFMKRPGVRNCRLCDRERCRRYQRTHKERKR